MGQGAGAGGEGEEGTALRLDGEPGEGVGTGAIGCGEHGWSRVGVTGDLGWGKETYWMEGDWEWLGKDRRLGMCV